MKHKTIYHRIGLPVLAAVFSMLLYSSCLPPLPDNVEDYDLTVTTFDEDYNFSNVQTYLLPDTVAHLTSVGVIPNTTFDDQILNSLERNLDALGWTRTTDMAAADVVVIATAFGQDNEVCYYWWDYWGYYWGYYPPYGGYPGYPGYASCSSFSTGSVVVQMVDRTIDTSAAELPLRWIGAMNGLLEGSNQNIAGRIISNIDQMFAQSPYLKN